MIYVCLYGRLGNNMFQIATAATLAKHYNTDFAAFPLDSYWCPEPDNCYLPEYIKQFKDNVFRSIKFVNTLPEGLPSYYDSDALYDLDVKGDFMINIYNVNLEYINRSIAQKLFAIETSIFNHLINKYTINFDSTIAIIVRRGDYLKIPHRYAICGTSYYREAMRRLGNNLEEQKYLIISDDLEWCKKVFKGDKFIFTRETTPLEDLYLTTMCRDTIVSNSTFALWGAYLNPNPQQRVCYPMPWHGIAQRRLDKGVNKMVDSSWIPVKNNNFYYSVLGLFYYVKAVITKITNKIKR